MGGSSVCVVHEGGECENMMPTGEWGSAKSKHERESVGTKTTVLGQ